MTIQGHTVLTHDNIRNNAIVYNKRNGKCYKVTSGPDYLAFLGDAQAVRAKRWSTEKQQVLGPLTLIKCEFLVPTKQTVPNAPVAIVKPAKPVKLPKSANMWVLSYENGASVGIFSMSHGGIGNGPRWYFARGQYVGAGRGQYFQAIEGSVRMLDYASGEALAEYDRIREIDAAFWRAKEAERLEADEAARIEAELADEAEEVEASAEPVEPTHAELEAVGQLVLL